jgi:hypothetical protein
MKDELIKMMDESFHSGCKTFGKSLLLSFEELQNKDIESLPINVIIDIIKTSMDIAYQHSEKFLDKHPPHM